MSYLRCSFTKSVSLSLLLFGCIWQGTGDTSSKQKMILKKKKRVTDDGHATTACLQKALHTVIVKHKTIANENANESGIESYVFNN